MQIKKFWAWYERYYTLNVTLAAILFTLQLIHLYWLTTHVVAFKLIGISFFNPSLFWQWVIILVDYTEIPALITTSLVYLYELKKRSSIKGFIYLIFLNSQFLHIFWITDEFVEDTLLGTGAGTILPLWLAWIAIVIDYLELPVIIETLGKAFKTLRGKVI